MTERRSKVGARFGAGDGIRGLACLFVVIHHVARHAGAHHIRTAGIKGADPVDIFGTLGGPVLWGARATPYIFFTLSGYLLARPFARAIVQGRPMPSIGRYAKSRALRIVPAFWLAWGLTFLFDGTAGATVTGILADLGFAQTLHQNAATGLMVQGWTLSVEFGFYIALPLAALALYHWVPGLPRRFSRGGWLLIVLALGGLVSLWIRAEWGNPVWKAWFPEYLIAFTPGLLLAVAEPMWADRLRGSETVRQLIPILVVGAAAALLWHGSVEGTELLWVSITGTLVAGCLVVGAMLREWHSDGAWRVFANPVSDWIGERSYGIYLLHFLILRQLSFVSDGIDSLWGSWLVSSAVVVPVTLLAAHLSYVLLERPIMNWGKRTALRPSKAPPSQPEMIAP
jgi:peptidoglycan/LPS O-acetylase OafA/YrhL